MRIAVGVGVADDLGGKLEVLFEVTTKACILGLRAYLDADVAHQAKAHLADALAGGVQAY